MMEYLGLFWKFTELLQHTLQQNWIPILKTTFKQKLSDVSFINPTSTVGMKLLYLWLLKRCVNNGVMTIKPDIRKLKTRTWSGQMSCPSCCYLHQEEFMFGEYPTVEHRGGSLMIWAAVPWYSVVPLLTFMAKRTGLVIRCIPRSRHYLWSMTLSSKTIMPTFTQLELFSNGLKSMKVNLIFPDQHNHQTWTPLNHSSQLRRLEWGAGFHLQNP
jgi:hypothetical protein